MLWLTDEGKAPMPRGSRDNEGDHEHTLESLSQKAEAGKPAVRPPSPWKNEGTPVLGSS